MSAADGTADGLGWLTDRRRHGGIDRVPLPADATGELWLCGKRAAAARYTDPSWDTVVCLVEAHELAGHHPDHLAWQRPGVDRAIWHPIPDLHAPNLDTMQELAGSIAVRLRDGERVLVHCAAGYGRSGTVAVCVLITLGVDPDGALATVSAARPGAGPEVGAQRELVERFRVAPGR